MKVSILGTGIMGTGFAHSLRRNNFDVSVWNRSPQRAQEVGHGVTVCSTAKDAVDDADFVITMLPDADAVREVIEPCLPKMTSAVWLQTSTVGIEGAEQLASLAEKFNVAFIDCPVLGTKQPAEEGKLTVLASGDKSLASRAQPVFDTLGKSRWLDSGPFAASAMKLVVNSYLLAITASMAESMTFGQQIGLPADEIVEVIGGGPLNAPYSKMKSELMAKGEYPTSFPLAMAAKDAQLVHDTADTLLPINSLLVDLYHKAEQNYAEEDIAAIKRVF